MTRLPLILATVFALLAGFVVLPLAAQVAASTPAPAATATPRRRRQLRWTSESRCRSWP